MDEKGLVVILELRWSFKIRAVSVDVKQYVIELELELRSCVKVEVAVLGSPAPIVRPYGLCGRKATVVISASRTSVGTV